MAVRIELQSILPQVSLGKIFGPFCWLLMWLSAITSLAQDQTTGNSQGKWLLKVSLNGGSVVSMEVKAAQLAWRDVVPGLPSEPRSIEIGDVEILVLAQATRMELISRIKSLAEQLEDRDFHVRESAEDELRRLPFDQVSSVLGSSLKQDNDEVSVRLRRILSGRTVRPPNPDQFDWIKLKNGQVLRGDAGQFRLDAQFQNIPISLDRSKMAAFSQAPTITEPQDSSQGKLGSPFPIEQLPDTTKPVNFDQDFVGQDRETGMNINDQFIWQGLRFAAEVNGHIGIKNTAKESERLGMRGRGICVFDTTVPDSVRIFYGTTRISFCQPGLSGIAQGIKQIGLGVETIDLPRDIILQAFNSDGQLLATIEANESAIAWLGLTVSEPIALVRVLSNPYLFHLARAAEVDRTYMIDNLHVSDGVPIVPLGASDQAIVGLKNGDSLLAAELKLEGQDSWRALVPELGTSFQFSLRDLAWIVMPKSSPPQPDKTTNHWFAMLADRSVLEVKPGATFSAVDWGNFDLSKEQLIAVWSSRDYLRFPMAEDFLGAAQVLVFPTARVACQNLALDEKGYSWAEANPRTILQPVVMPKTSQGEIADEDPSPHFQKLTWIDPQETQYPSIWFQEPPPASSELGYLNTRRGEKFVFGPGASFQLTANQVDGVLLTGPGGFQKLIPWEEVWKLKY